MGSVNEQYIDPIRGLMGLLFRAHPWHGIPIGNESPRLVTTYIEIVPSDTVKYEIDQMTGYLRIDRPQRFSNVCPTLYGFVPRTLCAERVAELCSLRAGREGIVGDGDALDICVLSERPITHGDILVQAIPIGGLRMIDGNEADDKIIAVMRGDAVYGDWQEIDQAPAVLVERLRHYFLTYKDVPGSARPNTEITHVYGRAEAHDVIKRSQQDYLARFGTLAGMPGGAQH